MVDLRKKLPSFPNPLVESALVEKIGGTMGEKKWAKNLGYGLFGALALFVSFYLTFPTQAVAQRLAHELNVATAGKYSASFGDVSLYRFTGLEAEEVTIRSAESGEAPTVITLDAFRARVNVLPLFLLSLVVNAEVELGEGVIDAQISTSSDEVGLDVAIEDLNFERPPVLPKLAGTPFGGVVEGSIEGVWNRAAMNKSEAEVTLTLKDAKVGPATFKGISLPMVGLGQLEIGATLKSGKLNVDTFKQSPGSKGPPDLEIANLAFGSTLRGTLKASNFDLCAQLKPNDAFAEKNPKVKSAADMATFQFKKDPQNYIHIPVRGSFGGGVRPNKGLCRPNPKK